MLRMYLSESCEFPELHSFIDSYARKEKGDIECVDSSDAHCTRGAMCMCMSLDSR